MASICTGVFLLAETGLLDGKSATLHWGFTETFRRKYPRVHLKPEQMFIDHGRLYCSAGVNAGMDLSLYLVEKFCGRQTATQSAKTMILDLGRNTQTPYLCYLFLQGTMAIHLFWKPRIGLRAITRKQLITTRLAKKFHMSRRSLERRFKQATGVTPLGYLQQLRVETAKRLLEDGGSKALMKSPTWSAMRIFRFSGKYL